METKNKRKRISKVQSIDRTYRPEVPSISYVEKSMLTSEIEVMFGKEVAKWASNPIVQPLIEECLETLNAAWQSFGSVKFRRDRIMPAMNIFRNRIGVSDMQWLQMQRPEL